MLFWKNKIFWKALKASYLGATRLKNYPTPQKVKGAIYRKAEKTRGMKIFTGVRRQQGLLIIRLKKCKLKEN